MHRAKTNDLIEKKPIPMNNGQIQKFRRKMRKGFTILGQWFWISPLLINFGQAKKGGSKVRPVILVDERIVNVILLPCTSKKHNRWYPLTSKEVDWNTRVREKRIIPDNTSYISWQYESVSLDLWNEQRKPHKVSYSPFSYRSEKLGVIKYTKKISAWLCASLGI